MQLAHGFRHIGRNIALPTLALSVFGFTAHGTIITREHVVAEFAFTVAAAELTLHFLIEVEGLVHGLLLALHQFAKLVHLLLHLALLALPLTLLTLLRLPHLQVVHQVLQLRQQFLRLIT